MSLSLSSVLLFVLLRAFSRRHGVVHAVRLLSHPNSQTRRRNLSWMAAMNRRGRDDPDAPAAPRNGGKRRLRSPQGFSIELDESPSFVSANEMRKASQHSVRAGR